MDQAKRAGKESSLVQMKQDNVAKYSGLLKQFVETRLVCACTSLLVTLPRLPKGRGRPTAEKDVHKFDWQQVSEIKREGTREELQMIKVPLCYSDFVDYYQNDAPKFERALDDS